MGELQTIRLRTLVWLILPIFVLIILPYLLRRLTHESFAWHWGAWLGLWLIVNGVALAAWCVNLFNVQGKGTPLPLDPPKRFVTSGPYRYVRNPMMLGVFLVLGGEAMMFQSSALLLYLLGIVVLAHLFVRCWEEPDLARRFGQPYREYQRQVPRWIPRKAPRARKTT